MRRCFQTLRVLPALIVGLTLASFFVAASAPTPSPRPPRWELKFKVVQDLRLIQYEEQYYWFMTYLVTNRTGDDQIFVPTATLATDAGDILRDGDVPFEVTNHLLDLIGKPLLESKNQIIGILKYGKENAREGLFVWKAGTLEDVREVDLFIAGLSSETQVVQHPITKVAFTVRKSLARHYASPGDLTADIREPVAYDSDEWIMR